MTFATVTDTVSQQSFSNTGLTDLCTTENIGILFMNNHIDKTDNYDQLQRYP